MPESCSRFGELKVPAATDSSAGSSGPSVAQGVGVEVGETEAAIDLDIVVEYGVSIAELGRGIQRQRVHHVVACQPALAGRTDAEPGQEPPVNLTYRHC